MRFRGFLNFGNFNLSFEKLLTNDQNKLTFQTNNFFLQLSDLSLPGSFKFYHTGKSGSNYLLLEESIISNNLQMHSLLETMDSSTFASIASSRTDPVTNAVWYDEDTNELTISRDSFGTVPVFYIFIPGSFLAFATDINLLFTFPQTKNYKSINSNKISSYLSLKDVNKLYDSETFFTSVHNLLPSITSCFNSDKLEMEVHTIYNIQKWSQLNSLEQYGKLFRDFFEKAVGRSLSKHKIIGAHLSGGMDSSSVIATIKHLRPESDLHSLYFEADRGLSDDTVFSKLIADQVSSKHHVARPHSHHLDHLIKVTSWYGQPQFMLDSSNINDYLMGFAKDLNLDVLLTGHDGDSIVGYGQGYLKGLLEKSDWVTLEAEISNLARFDQLATFNPNWMTMSIDARKKVQAKMFFYNRLVEAIKTRSLPKCYKILVTASYRFKISPGSMITRLFQALINKLNFSKKIPLSVHKELATNLSKNLNPGRLYHKVTDNLNGQPSSYYTEILNNQNVRILEEYYCLGANYNIDIQHPFFDPDLYELSLAVPASLKFDKGRGRGHHREAMKGILPESLRTRTNKVLYNTYARSSALLLYQQAQDYLTDKNEVWNYVDKTNFSKAVMLLKSEDQSIAVHHRMTFFINRTIFLSVWLEMVKLNSFG